MAQHSRMVVLKNRRFMKSIMSRIIEGASTGLMLAAHLANGKVTVWSATTFGIQWFMSFRFHLTRKHAHMMQDFLWIQFLATERLQLCNPYGALVARAMTLLLPLPRHIKAFYITSYCALCHFLLLFLAWGEGYLFGLFSLLAAFIYLSTKTRNTLRCILFHMAIAATVYFDRTKDRCSYHAQPLYPRYYDFVYYIIASRRSGAQYV